jgi:hypothetical protein
VVCMIAHFMRDHGVISSKIRAQYLGGGRDDASAGPLGYSNLKVFCLTA